MRHHDATQADLIPDGEALGAYKELLDEFFRILYPSQPKKFFRYRKFSDLELENLRNGTAWFSHPDQFDDSLDSALNVDLEAEIDEMLGPNGDEELKKRFSVSFVAYLLKQFGIQVNPELISEAFEKTESSGFDVGLLNFFEKYLDQDTSQMLLAQTKGTLDNVCNDKLKEAVLGWVNNFQDSNRKIRAALFELCLAEEGDNDAMWGTYADNCKGFCIQYEIPPSTVHGAMILSNLFPIYYGEKERIRLSDILRRGVFNLNQEMVVEGIAQSDYEVMHLSSYTKSPIWEFQKEWRVTYGDKNLQPFPYATAVILGERMEEQPKEKLINLAREVGLTVYQRKLNTSGSKIICVELK